MESQGKSSRLVPWLALAVAALVSCAPAQAAGTSIEVRSERIEDFRARYPAESRFGALEWLGGLELSSPDPRFGGYSGLLSLDGGSEILALSDRGSWLRLQLSQKADGTPLAVSETIAASLIGEKGEELSGKHSGDSEGLDLSPDGQTLYVSLEGRHRILSYDLSASPKALPPAGKAHALPGQAGFAGLSRNKGLEALAVRADGSLVVLAERPPQEGADHPGWIIPQGGRGRALPFRLARRDEFDVTDAAFLPSGDLLVLERRFNLRHGLGMRLLRIGSEELKGGALIEGEVIMEGDLRHQIDNMEALAVHRSAGGATILTLMSDDNQSVLQRTLLLRFRLVDTDATPRAKP